MTLVHQLIGSGDNDKRRLNDFYPTPDYATNALLDNVTFDGPVWEPACGDGAISKLLIKRGYETKSTDLHDYGYGQPGIDFLKTNQPFDNIVTNVPFNIGTEFTLRALEIAQKKVAIFHKLAFLEGLERREKIFNLKILEYVLVFSRRVGFIKDNSKQGGMMAFAWFVWNKEFKGNPQIKWV